MLGSQMGLITCCSSKELSWLQLLRSKSSNNKSTKSAHSDQAGKVRIFSQPWNAATLGSRDRILLQTSTQPQYHQVLLPCLVTGRSLVQGTYQIFQQIVSEINLEFASHL